MSHTALPIGSQPLDRLLGRVRQDIAGVPRATVPMIGALVSVEAGLPGWFRDWLMAELGQRVPLEVATPAAEAVMRIREFGHDVPMDFALRCAFKFESCCFWMDSFFLKSSSSS